MRIGSRKQVFMGEAHHTVGGLEKKDIVRVQRGTRELKDGRIRPIYNYVSKKKREKAKSNPWIQAVSKARKSLGIKGMVKLNVDRNGVRLYQEAKRIHNTMKRRMSGGRRHRSRSRSRKRSRSRSRSRR
tara:strand:+ start:2693 stop:3079 length:387 start_codon:yes stop_codon:yes gene_type:complete